MIRALVSGVLHSDPQARTSQNGNRYTTAKLRADTKDGGSVWCSLIAFGAEGERLATLKAGVALSVSGRAEVQAWLGKDGEPKAGLSIVVDELITLKGKPRPPQDREASWKHHQNHLAPVVAPAAPLDDVNEWQP